jgi:hypothetical protein
MVDSAVTAIAIAVIGAVTTISRTWLRARRGRTHELREGHIYRLPPRCHIHRLGRHWVAVESQGRPAGPNGRSGHNR